MCIYMNTHMRAHVHTHMVKHSYDIYGKIQHIWLIKWEERHKTARLTTISFLNFVTKLTWPLL